MLPRVEETADCALTYYLGRLKLINEHSQKLIDQVYKTSLRLLPLLPAAVVFFKSRFASGFNIGGTSGHLKLSGGKQRIF